MVRVLLIFLLFVCLLSSLSGCAMVGDNAMQGLLFTYTRTPYTRDLHNTHMPGTGVDGKIIRITEPFTGYGLYSEINTNALADIAHAHGLTELYFADLETFSVLGIWSHNKLILYGK